MTAPEMARIERYLADLDVNAEIPSEEIVSFCANVVGAFEAVSNQAADPIDPDASSRAAWAALAWGRSAFNQGDLPLASVQFSRASELAVDDLALQALSLARLGATHQYQGHEAEATTNLFAALDIATALGDPWVLGRVHYAVAASWHIVGAPALSIESAERALGYATEAGDAVTRCQAMAAIGSAMGDLGEIDAGIERVEASLHICDSNGFERFAAFFRASLTNLYRAAGRVQEASARVSANDPGLAELPAAMRAVNYVSEAEVHLKVGAYAEALELLDRARSVAENDGPQPDVLRYFDVASRALEAAGRHEEANSVLRESLAANERLRGRDFEDRIVALERRHAAQQVDQADELHQAWASEILGRYVELSSLYQWKTEALEMVAHDLRSPISALRLRTETQRQANDQTENLDDYLEVTEGLAAELESTVQALFDSVTVTGFPQPSGEFSVADVVADVVERRRWAAESKGITIVFSEEQQDLGAFGDAHFLRRALENIVSNATKYSSADSVVTVRLTPVASRVEISVTDCGPGLRDADREHIFERYRVLSSSPSGGERKTGLGLFIARRLIEAISGTIELRSTSPSGSTFVISLPISRW